MDAKADSSLLDGTRIVSLALNAPGPVAAARLTQMGAAITKVGRTTEQTFGEIKSINAKLTITYPNGKARFINQVLTSKAFGAFGDSGALAVLADGTRRPVGIVIAGGTNGAAVISPMGPILERFGATVCDD